MLTTPLRRAIFLTVAVTGVLVALVWGVGATLAPDRLICRLPFPTGAVDVEFSPDSRILLCAGGEDAGIWTGRTVAWDTRTWLPLHEWQGACRLGGFARNGSQVLLLHENGTAVLWSTSTWEPLHTFLAGGTISLGSRWAVLSPDGTRIAVQTRSSSAPNYIDYKFRVFDTRTRKPLTPPTKLRELLYFAPDSRHVAYLDVTGWSDVSMIDSSTVAPPRVTGEECIAFSRSQGVAATADRTDIGLWNLRTWAQLSGFAANGTEGISYLAVSEDAHLIAIGSAVSRGARVYDAATGWELASLPGGYSDSPLRQAFSPRGDKLALASGSEVQVWEIGSRDRLMARALFRRLTKRR